MRDVALFFHILGVLAFAAGVAVAGVAFEIARRRSEPAEIALVLRAARAGAVLVGLGVPVLAVFGLWLVHLEHLAWDEGWVVAAIALFALALALGAIGGRRPRLARERAEHLAGHGEPADDELRALLADRTSRACNHASAALVLVILGLMVFQP